MTSRAFRQIDVFGSGPFTGNPVAVVLGADDLDTEEMKRISAWTNLSECTFVLQPTDPAADYRVRIFSLTTELPFAGHPTLGTARAWMDAGGVPATPGRLVQECGVGLVPLRVDADGTTLAFAAPALIRGGEVEADVLADVVAILGIDAADVVTAEWIDNGPGWIGVLLRDAEAVLAVAPDRSRASRTGAWSIGVVGPHTDGRPEAIEVRGFFSDGDSPLIEDPVTGSLNASIAQWLLRTERVRTPYTAIQGTRVGRDGRVQITQDDGDVWVGGTTTVAISGHIETA